MSGQEQPPKRAAPPRYVPFVSRAQGMGTTGWEGYTIGFTLVGCIMAGAGLGWWLDNHFGTSYWLPILFLVGVVAGFREMLVTLKRMSQADERRRQAKSEREAANVYTPPAPDAAPEVEPSRERLFAVPPPPFEDALANAPRTGDAPPETTEDIIERLLAETQDEPPSGQDKRRNT